MEYLQFISSLIILCFLFLENHEVRNIGFYTTIQEIIGLIVVSTSPRIFRLLLFSTLCTSCRYCKSLALFSPVDLLL